MPSDLERQLQQAILIDFYGPAESLQRALGGAAVEQRFAPNSCGRRIGGRGLLQLVDESELEDGLAAAVARCGGRSTRWRRGRDEPHALRKLKPGG